MIKAKDVVFEYQKYDEEGNVLSEGNKLIFEGFAPDSDDSEFG